MISQQTPAAVAFEFSEVLRNWLTPEEMDEAILRNANEYKDSNVCASHDFCDANMAMYEAFHNLGFKIDIDYDGWDDYINGGHPIDEVEIVAASELWAAAWDIAKKSNFNQETF